MLKSSDVNYCMPVVKDDGIIKIKEGRHPVIEKMIGSGNFVLKILSTTPI